jgi:hypothetical protein
VISTVLASKKLKPDLPNKPNGNVTDLPQMTPQADQDPDPPKPLIHGGCAVILCIFIVLNIVAFLLNYFGIDF